MDQEQATGSHSKINDPINNPSESDSMEKKEETRVITLDTIIRKGLVEQMPMTAKDINSIVALSMQKEREKQAADRLRLAALNPRRAEYDDEEEEDSDSSDYDSSNDNEFDSNPAPSKQLSSKNSEITKEPPSVIHRAPKESRSMILTEDLKSTQDDAEDFELKSGDLHYSESNPSDYSESEIRLSSSQSSLKKRLTLSRKRDLSPIAEPLNADKEFNDESSKKQRIETSTSCTDSKRNAILLQCSSGFVGGTSKPASSPILLQVDDDLLSQKSLSPSLQIDNTNESSEHSCRDRGLDISSMLQVQHSMDEDNPPVLQDETKPVVVKLECESPAENMLEIHHVEDYQPDIQITPQSKSGRGGRKAKTPFNRSTYSEKKSASKTTQNKRTKKTKTNEMQSDSTSPLIESTAGTASTPPTPKQRQNQKRDRRQTVRSNPVYAELSESSCDNMDIASSKSKPSSSVTVTPLTDPLSISSTSLPTPKIHWKTQLKMQRKQNEPTESDNSFTNHCVSSEQTKKLSTSTSAQRKIYEENDNNPDEHDGLHTEEVTVINKIIEPPHHQKRIPKLKYGSFNFTERRGGLAKGPKMVLKYKKKYKKKNKSSQMQTEFVTASEDADIVDEAGAAGVNIRVFIMSDLVYYFVKFAFVECEERKVL